MDSFFERDPRGKELKYKPKAKTAVLTIAGTEEVEAGIV